MKHPYLFLFFFISLFTVSFGQKTDDQIRIENRENARENFDKPYVILISVDGFRHDYFDKYQPDFLKKMKKKGVSAKAMVPSYPSVTFPNHYTIVTGLIPPHHGLVGNNMLDRKTGERYSLRNTKAVQNPEWYGGFPIWSLAESQDMLSACYYWPGSEAPIQDLPPSYYYPYAETKGVEERIESVVEWLELPEEKRPHLITFYMPDVDHAGHRYGPDAIETQSAVNYIDHSIKKLTEEVEKTGLPVNFIFLSDHGMTALDTENPLQLPEINPEEMEIASSGVYVSVFVKNPEKIDSAYDYFKENATEEYRVYLRDEVPEKYLFSTEQDKFDRIGDIVLIAEAPYYFSQNNLIPKGSHGYHPEDTPEMKTVFLAWGPDIRKSKKIDEFKNIHIYPLLAHLLELDYDQDAIDGDERLVKKVLKK